MLLPMRRMDEIHLKFQFHYSHFLYQPYWHKVLCCGIRQGVKDPVLFPPSALLAEALGGETQLLPTRRVDIDGKSFSTVLRGSSVCHPNAPLDFHTLAASHRGATADKREVCLNPKPEADPKNNPASDPNSDP